MGKYQSLSGQTLSIKIPSSRIVYKLTVLSKTGAVTRAVP